MTETTKNGAKVISVDLSKGEVLDKMLDLHPLTDGELASIQAAVEAMVSRGIYMDESEIGAFIVHIIVSSRLVEMDEEVRLMQERNFNRAREMPIRKAIVRMASSTHSMLENIDEINEAINEGEGEQRDERYKH